MEIARDHGYTEGYAIPMHAVDGRGRPMSALMALFWRNRPDLIKQPASLPSWLRLAAMMYHERLVELRGFSTVDKSEETTALTDREREVLVWACRGKTQSETAIILGITERTIAAHFERAMRKLNVHNKFHAISTAILKGLIAP